MRLCCRSSFVMIRQLTGIDRLISCATQKRKYLCRDCNHVFRRPERRRGERRPGPEHSEGKTSIRTGHIRAMLLKNALRNYRMPSYRYCFTSVLTVTILAKRVRRSFANDDMINPA